MSLTGKVAIVTGGNSGIGRAIYMTATTVFADGGLMQGSPGL